MRLAEQLCPFQYVSGTGLGTKQQKTAHGPGFKARICYFLLRPLLVTVTFRCLGLFGLFFSNFKKGVWMLPSCLPLKILAKLK